MRSDYALQWIPREGTRQQRVDPYGKPFVLRINSSGQRGADLERRHPAQRRILFIGDSFTIASSLREQDLFVEHTQRLLSDALGKPIRTINGGVDGYNTFQELAYYRYHGKFLQPDVVVLCFYVGNDFRDNAVGTQRGGDLNPVLIPQAMIDQYKEAPDPFLRHQDRTLLRDPLSGTIVPKPAWAWMEALQRRSLFMRLLGSRYARAKGKWTDDLWLLDLENRYYFYEIGLYQQRNHPLIRLTRNLTLDCIAQMRSAVEADGAEFMVLILPAQNQVDPAHWQQTLSSLEVEEENLGPLHMAHPNQVIGEFCSSHKIPYLDLLTPFAAADRPQDLYLGIVQDLHFSPAGHQLAAKEITNFLLTQSIFLTDPAIDNYRNGLELLRGGDLDRATEHLRLSVDNMPAWNPAQVALGDLYRRMGSNNQAETAYRKALTLDPLSLKALDGLGQVLLANADTNAAIALYKEALAVRPGWLPFYDQLLDLYISRQKRQEAESISRRRAALIDSKENVKGYWLAEYNFIGDLHTRQQQLPKAEQVYRQALKLDPASAATWNNLAGVLYQQQQTEAAIAAHETALKHDPLHLEARASLAVIYYKLGLGHEGAKQQAYYKKAMAENKQVLAVDSTYKEALNNLGSVYRALGQDQAAENIFLKSIAAHPDYAIAYFNLGGLYAQQERYENAVQQYQKTIELEPHKASHYYVAGVTYFLLGKLSEAEKVVRQAHNLDPQEADYLYGLGEVLLMQGEQERASGHNAAATERWLEAQGHYRQAIALNPHHQAAVARLSQLENALAAHSRSTTR